MMKYKEHDSLFFKQFVSKKYIPVEQVSHDFIRLMKFIKTNSKEVIKAQIEIILDNCQYGKDYQQSALSNLNALKKDNSIVKEALNELMIEAQIQTNSCKYQLSSKL